MPADLSITDADAAGLAELAALDLAMARNFAQRAQAESDAETANALARSYHRMARSYRQTLALKARLEREGKAAAAGAAAASAAPSGAYAPPAARDVVRIAERVEDLREACQRVIWAEHEPAEPPETEIDDIPGVYFEGLEAELSQRSRRDRRFGESPLDEHVAELCVGLGLSVRLARRWRDLPRPPDRAFIDWSDPAAGGPFDAPPAQSSA